MKRKQNNNRANKFKFQLVYAESSNHCRWQRQGGQKQHHTVLLLCCKWGNWVVIICILTSNVKKLFLKFKIPFFVFTILVHYEYV